MIRYYKDKYAIAGFETLVKLYKYDDQRTDHGRDGKKYVQVTEFGSYKIGVRLQSYMDVIDPHDLDEMDEIDEWYYNHALSYIEQTKKIVKDVYIDYAKE